MAEALAKGRNMEMDLRKQRESTTAEEKCMQSDMMELWIQRQRQVTGVRKKSNPWTVSHFQECIKRERKVSKGQKWVLTLWMLAWLTVHSDICRAEDGVYNKIKA